MFPSPTSRPLARCFGNRNTTRVALTALLALALLVIPTGAANASVTMAMSNTTPTTDAGGYAWVSYFRGLAGLPGVTRNATLEYDDALHVLYLANHALTCETNVHDELTTRVAGCGANPYATSAGKAAANNSDITRVSVDVTDRTAVSNWFSAAFHALVLLDPRLTSTGYASYYTTNPTGSKPLAWNYTAAVDVYRGRSGSYNGSTVVFPANDSVTPLLSYSVGTESPEPFRTSVGSCRSWGSATTVSAPVIVQWPIRASGAAGLGVIVDLSTGRALPTCTLNAGSYAAGSEGRTFLSGANNGITQAAFYYASTPFLAGHRYQLRIGSAPMTTFTAGLPPSAVTPRVSGGHGTIGIAWSPASAGTGSLAPYEARAYATLNCTGSVIAAANTTQTSTTLGGFTPGRYYSVRVASVNTVGASRWSACVGFRAT